MLRGLGRIASLAIVVALATVLVGCSQYGKLRAKQAFKDANVLYSQQEYKRAAALYEEAIQNDPELSVAYFYLANSYDNLFRPSGKGEAENDAYLTKAIEYYTKASEKEQDPTLRKRSFEFLVAAYGPDKMNDPSQQEPIVQRMIQLDPQDATNYFALAKIREDAGDYVKAEEVLQQAKQARPNDPQVYLQLAGFYTRQEEFEKTIDALNQRASIEPNNPEAFYIISTYYWDKAYRDFRLKEPEKKEYVIRSSGKGGQKVNKTATCVYLKHLPTRLEVKWMEDRSQSVNRFLARRGLVGKIEKHLGLPTEKKIRISRVRKQKSKRAKRSQGKYALAGKLVTAGEVVPGEV